MYVFTLWVGSVVIKQKYFKLAWFFIQLSDYLSLFQVAALGKNPLAGLAALGLTGLAPTGAGALNPAGEF